MNLLFCGDVVGRSGREAVVRHVPGLRQALALDFVVANGENAAHGFGLTEKICQELFRAGVDVITGGNHTWDRAEILPFLDAERRLLRPVNYPEGTPGRGVGEYADARGRKVLVINVMARLFMELLDDPFAALEAALPAASPKAAGYDAVIVDMHGEATSEKMALGHVADGRASFIVGTHTHVPTADVRVMNGGTAYQSDVGMCGDYDSVIGMEPRAAIRNFLRRFPKERLTPASGEATLCALYVETDDETGLARRAEAVRIGGCLSPAGPAPQCSA